MIDSSTIRLGGVIPILPVPFRGDGEVDEASFCRVVDVAIQDGVHGVALFGLASEYAKLRDRETERLTSLVIEQAAARVPVVISITHHSREVAVVNAKAAERRGADAIMVLPPFFLNPDSASVSEHIRAVADAVRLPVIVQYAPAQTGLRITAQEFAELNRQCPNLQYVKVDANPAGPLVSSLSAVGLQAMVGYMGLNLPEDYERHAIAVMPTVSVGRVFAHLWQLLTEDPAEAKRFHETLLPLLNFMMQSVEQLVAIEKLLLTRRGIFEDAYCRAPRWKLDDFQLREVDRLWTRHAEWFPSALARTG